MPDGPTPGSGSTGGSDIQLDDLYRDILLDHYRHPRHKGELGDQATHVADGANPLCGDELRVELTVEDGAVTGVAIEGRGCSISQASASMMTVYVDGRPVADALAAVETFQRMMLENEIPPDEFGDIEALTGVRKFPVRVKCASLSWKTLEQALIADNESEPVTTDNRSEA